MSPHRDAARLRHMPDHAREAGDMVAGKARDDLDADRQLNLAPVRLLEIVGEAAGRVSGETKAAHPKVAWADIVGLRNRLIHGYDEVDFDILWAILTGDLPPPIQALEGIIAARD